MVGSCPGLLSRLAPTGSVFGDKSKRKAAEKRCQIGLGSPAQNRDIPIWLLFEPAKQGFDCQIWRCCARFYLDFAQSAVVIQKERNLLPAFDRPPDLIACFFAMGLFHSRVRRIRCQILYKRAGPVLSVIADHTFSH